MWKLQTHCNLRPLDATPIVIRFNYDAHAKVGFDWSWSSKSIRLRGLIAHQSATVEDNREMYGWVIDDQKKRFTSLMRGVQNTEVS